MKLTKQELKQRISDSITDNDDLVISLLEDIEDSMNEDSTADVLNESLQKENEDLKYKYEVLKARYKERFLSGDNAEEKIEEETKKDEGLQEKEYIDIKEI